MSLDHVIDADLLHSIPMQPQVHCSTDKQLRALHIIALRFGLYGAAGFIRPVDQIIGENP